MRLFKDLTSTSECSVVIFASKSKQLVGSIKYSPESHVVVKLHDQGGMKQMPFWVNNQHQVLHGQLAGGRYVTLFGCIATSTSIGGSGILDVTLKVSHMVVGAQIARPDTPIIKRIDVSMTSLNDWFGSECIEITQEKLFSQSSRSSFHIRCTHTQQIGFSPLNGAPSVLSNQTIKPRHKPPDSASIESQYSLQLIVREQVGMESVWNELFKLQSFISMLCGYESHFLSIEVYDDKDKPGTPMTYVPLLPKYHESNVKSNAVLPMSKVNENLPLLWYNWTEQYDRLRTAVELFMSIGLHKGQLLNFQYLAMMQSLETYHRNMKGGQYLETDEYADIQKKLTECLSIVNRTDLRSSLESRIKYGNEYSLRKRLNNLVQSLPKKITNEFHDNIKEYINILVETRNYLTHYPEGGHEGVLDDEGQYWAIKFLRLVFVTILFVDIGLTEDNVLFMLSNSAELKQVRSYHRGSRSPVVVEEVKI